MNGPRKVLTKEETFGIVTIAAGPPVFIEMAKNLARSLEWSGMTLPRAVITDRADTGLERFYHHVIHREELRAGHQSKLTAHRTSPFLHTYFIDSDCLVYEQFHLLSGTIGDSPFMACGEKIATVDWAGCGPAFVREKLSPAAVGYVLLHSGFFYARCDAEGGRIFEKALEIEPLVRESFPASFGRMMSSDILLSLAAAALGWERHWPKDPAIMSAARLWTDPPRLDIRRRAALTTVNGRPTTSHIVHFMDGFKDQRLYRTEARRLQALVPQCSLTTSFVPAWTFAPAKKTLAYRLWTRFAR